jgi:hypothetical protein
MVGIVERISYNRAVRFLLPKHYSGRKPNIMMAFGWLVNDKLVAVCTFGKPASPSLCKGVCGEKHSSNVIELNRLCRTDNLKIQISCFVGACLRELKSSDYIVVSYSDTEMNHHGYIYQACNFYYTGCTKKRTDKYTDGNKHSRHYSNENQVGKRKVRSAKHRYIYFCTSSKKTKAKWLNDLKYKIEPYPKGDNSNYVLGDFLEPTIIEKPAT